MEMGLCLPNQSREYDKYEHEYEHEYEWDCVIKRGKRNIMIPNQSERDQLR